MESETQSTEYAPLYSAGERVRLIATTGVPVLLLVASWRMWGLPQYQAFVKVAHCRTILGFPGTSVLFYGLFVGLPVCLALLIAAMVLPTSVKALRARCYPPPGQKTFRRTKIKRGWKAVFFASTGFFCVAYLLILAVWGGFAAHNLLHESEARLHAAQASCHSARSL